MGGLRYDLLALDLDGTLLGPDGRVSSANVEAVERARRAGLEVVVCTGRGVMECGAPLEQLGMRGGGGGRDATPVVCSGGAIVSEAASGRTLRRWAMDHGLVRELCDHFAGARRAPLLLKDRDAAGFDYLVVDSGPLEAPTRWWFDVMDVEVKFVPHVDADEHPEHTIRVGFAATTAVMREMAEGVRGAFGGRATVHSFAAVSGTGEGGPLGVKDDTIHLLEVFDQQVNKWSAVRWLAQRRGIARERVAAVGDEINDLALIEGAGLGVAMGNAIERVKDAADYVTGTNAEDGVARAIGMMLDGSW